jgi:hypothetical protein
MEGLDEAAGLRTCAFKIGIATAVLTSLFCYYTSLQNTPYQLAKQREVRSSAILSVAKTVECPSSSRKHRRNVDAPSPLRQIQAATTTSDAYLNSLRKPRLATTAARLYLTRLRIPQFTAETSVDGTIWIWLRQEILLHGSTRSFALST